MDLTKFKVILSQIEEEDRLLDAHMSRVGMMASQLGREFNVRQLDQERLYMAGVLHEIGRFYLNTQVTVNGDKKPNTDAIYPLVSMAMIAAHDEFSYVATIVSQHAENIDGSGQPFGSSGDDVHVYSAFVRIADFYDHMRMAGKTHDECTTAIRENTNKIFPKKIITPFIKMLITDSELQFDYKTGGVDRVDG